MVPTIAVPVTAGAIERDDLAGVAAAYLDRGDRDLARALEIACADLIWLSGFINPGLARRLPRPDLAAIPHVIADQQR
jgi:hypothetical protein